MNSRLCNFKSLTILFFTIVSSLIANAAADLGNIKLIGTNETVREQTYHAEWTGRGRWIGREWWANPLWDWQRVENDRVRAPASSKRSLSLLPIEISCQGDSFTIQTTLSFSKTSTYDPLLAETLAAGFAIGRSGPLDDYRSAAVYSSAQLDAVINVTGTMSLAKTTVTTPYSIQNAPITLTLTGKRERNSVLLTLTARQFKSKVVVSSSFPLRKVTGPLALITEGPNRTAEEPALAYVTFEKFSVSGTMIKRYNERIFGAVMWSQYTVSEQTLRLQAQLAPLDDSVLVKLILRSSRGGGKLLTQVSWSEKLSRTAQFTVNDWDSKRGGWYELQVQLMGQLHRWSGIIQNEPPVTKPFKLAAFSCDNGYLFPQNRMVAQVSQQNPDLLYFAGDQIYNPVGGFLIEQYARTDVAMLDYLLRWYLFGWMWRSLLRDRPSVILPDDHDVFQGNLWGDGGRAFERSKEKDWRYGGYLMPGSWVSAVERCNTGHLPPSRANFTTPLGLKPYFTSLIYSGLSMAVLEDRKFKSAPGSFAEPDLTFGDGGSLLGSRQEKFLERWVKEWKGALMKVAFSQTIFCNAATHAGKDLYRVDHLYDSGGWPFDARNRVVKLMGDGNVLALHGDQHLGMLMRHGVKKHDDAGVAFMVPGAANGYPRAWFPGVGNDTAEAENKNFTGRFIDDTGHPVTVLAVGNPKPRAHLLDFEETPRMQLGRAKGSGYGMVVLNRQSKTATFHLYRVGGKMEQFEGFPKRVLIGGKP